MFEMTFIARFQDHINVSPAATLVGQHITAEDMQNPDFAAAQWKLYRESKSGMLSATPSTFVFLDAKSFIPEDVLDRMISALDRELEKGDYPASPWRKAFELQRAWLTSSEVAQLEIVLFPGLLCFIFLDLSLIKCSIFWNDRASR